MVAHVLKMNLWKHKKRLTLQGDIVISVGVFDHSVDSECWEKSLRGGTYRRTGITCQEKENRR